MTIRSKPCPSCKQTIDLQVNAEDFAHWRAGELIQKCFPYLDRDERERLVSGYCQACWDRLWKGEVQ